MSTDIEPHEAPATIKSKPPRVGDELPIFCEKCGYALHGMPQVRCEHCRILQFQCPECGHHQPINTLRPAAIRILGRMRAVGVLTATLIALAYFGILFFAWVGTGASWSNANRYYSTAKVTAEPLSAEMLRAFSTFGILFGFVSRLMLLRWRNGAIVGLALAAFVCTAVALGAWIELHDRAAGFILSDPLVMATGIAAGCIILASTLSWTIWSALVFILVPRRAGKALLAWQRAMSAPMSEPVDDRPAVVLAE